MESSQASGGQVEYAPKPNKFEGVEHVDGAIQLCLPDGKPISSAWACSACGLVWNDGSSAARCCKCSYCGLHRPWTGGNTSHDECWKKHRQEIDAETLEKATLIEWDGEPIFYDDHVYQGPDEVIERFLDGHAPEFIFATTQQGFSFDLESALENTCEEHHEDMYESLDGLDDLHKAVDAFNEINKGNLSYFEDCKHKIRLQSETRLRPS